MDKTPNMFPRPGIHRPRAPDLVRPGQHERQAVRPGTGPLPQPRPLRAAAGLLPELQPLQLRTEQSADLRGSGRGVFLYPTGVNIPLGDLGYLSLSPAIAFGGGGFQFGASAGLSMPGPGDFSIGVGSGLDWGKDAFTGNRGWTSSVTGAIGYNDGTHSLSLSTTRFNSPGLRTQTLGTFSYRHKSGWGAGYSKFLQIFITTFSAAPLTPEGGTIVPQTSACPSTIVPPSGVRGTVDGVKTYY